MATSLMSKTLNSVKNLRLLAPSLSINRRLASTATLHQQPPSDGDSSSFTFNDAATSAASSSSSGSDVIFVKAPDFSAKKETAASTVTMPPSFMSGSVLGKRFYKQVTTRVADDENGWTVMLDYRTLKTPSKRPLKLPTLALAKAIAAEWDYQTDGIRPFTMPLMKLACTALERVPLTRQKIIEGLMQKFNQDLVFCRAPDDNDLTSGVYERQVEKIDPLLDWLKSEFGFKPVVYLSFFGGKQDEGLVKAIENLLKKTSDCELAAIDAIAAGAHSLVIAVGIFRGRLSIEEAIELVRLEEDLQVDRWGLVEGGHDIDIADLRVQISSATVFLGLSRI
ncbi:hypothetical protein K2173_021030 [Erythroxylum novogranatense]|uniref:ATP synthase mitochondrial F1 complex assembly factor 2 n=1 Tax=Erythroxylum novogranatense TaxID=1862640 RepID=A0AAV8TQ19_9ROSI|nr:hypothetical protein K2173_021030 [Erythroxylum novogranatense]